MNTQAHTSPLHAEFHPFFFFQAEDGIRDAQESRGLGDVYKRQIYNQVNATQPSRDGNQTEYRDGQFVSIYFGSVGPDRDRTQQNTISLFGIYPVGGKYDDGSATIATANSGTGAAPYRLITYADRLYLEAELINTGVITGDAKAKLAAAMDESFKQVDYVITNFINPSQNVPALFGTPAVATYTDKVLAEYDACLLYTS